jgi:predicted DNA-binding transcriptional regulator AlpA
MNALTLRQLTVPRYAMRKDEVATSLGISPSTFQTWVDGGLMPKGKKIRGVVLWDCRRVEMAWQRLLEDPDQEMPEPEWGDEPA